MVNILHSQGYGNLLRPASHVALALFGILGVLSLLSMLSNYSLKNVSLSSQPAVMPSAPSVPTASAVHIESNTTTSSAIATTTTSSVPTATPQPVVGKVSMVYGDLMVFYRALESHEEHAHRHNYPMFVLRQKVLEGDGVWNKPLKLLTTIVEELEKPEGERLQWLFWFDGDTVLMNLNLPLEIFLPPPDLADVNVLLSRDWNGINNGNFFIRVHPQSVNLLNAVLAWPLMNPDSALTHVLEENEEFSRGVVYCPSRWFNPYKRSDNGELPITEGLPADMIVHPGDLLVHFAGVPGEAREPVMGAYIKISAEERPDWSAPVEETGYTNETARFWQRHREP
ncbi:galactosyl transferase GMA12/MNN10 family protein [Penicillium argentinense]|uniref:Galactosyl transferase GMA12/MNN10 family protein n=1 Tax=Penicillium argentinense TaxID=1131581 RepID=A0A9W9G375_9EURO|nr:galactosyl transferase GMA12/MNN10 family protein [Penicillium argentinense]KAJ5111203.1 galactosyl transferase GMA12/MNN10 family protein [Penicillium argentinense]